MLSDTGHKYLVTKQFPNQIGNWQLAVGNLQVLVTIRNQGVSLWSGHSPGNYEYLGVGHIDEQTV
jgi:hypothetical protein